MEGYPLGAPSSTVLYSSKRTARYLRLETLVAEAICAAHGELPDAKPQQTEARPPPRQGIHLGFRSRNTCSREKQA